MDGPTLHLSEDLVPPRPLLMDCEFLSHPFPIALFRCLIIGENKYL